MIDPTAKADMRHAAARNPGQLIDPTTSRDVIDMHLAEERHPAVVSALRAYDPALVIYHDRGVGRWGVARFSRGGTHFVMLWQDDAGNALPLDMRLVDAIKKWDLRRPHYDRPRTANEEADRRDARDLGHAAAVDRQFDEDISYLTRANKHRLVRALERAT